MSTRVTRSKRPRDPTDLIAKYDGDEYKPQPKKKSKKTIEPELDGQADSQGDAALVTDRKGKAKKVKKETKKDVETNAVLTGRDDAVSLELPSNLRLEKNTSGRWLMKSEPDAFSLDNLFSQYEEKGPAEWDGIRNHVAKNNLASMKTGDLAFFYHSNTKEPGIVGIMEIVKEASVDETQFDPKAKYYDSKVSKSSPRWIQVHVKPVRRMKRLIGLAELRTHSNKELKDMALFKQTRLSVGPVGRKEWDYILALE